MPNHRDEKCTKCGEWMGHRQHNSASPGYHAFVPASKSCVHSWAQIRGFWRCRHCPATPERCGIEGCGLPEVDLIHSESEGHHRFQSPVSQPFDSPLWTNPAAKEPAFPLQTPEDLEAVVAESVADAAPEIAKRTAPYSQPPDIGGGEEAGGDEYAPCPRCNDLYPNHLPDECPQGTLRELVENHVVAMGPCADADEDAEENLCNLPDCTYCPLARALGDTNG